MERHRSHFERYVDGELVRDTVRVQIKAERDEMMKVVVGNSLPVIGKAYEVYGKEKAYFEEQGYTITEEDLEKLTFEADKHF